MIAEIDIWHAAKLIVDQYGQDAPIQAATRADQILKAGDLDGRAVWKRIKKAAEKMLQEQPEGPVH